MKNKSLNKTIFAYEGPFFIELLAVFGNYIKFITKNYPSSKAKLFKIFIELSQNVANYSEKIHTFNDTKIGVGKLLLVEKNDAFYFTTKNLVLNHHSKILAERCDYINKSDKTALRELKREQRLKAHGIKYGARIGLIHAVILSKNPLSYSVEYYDNKKSYFIITTKIGK
ncbi:MAG: SiaB family protein kinase [Bacteroidales bacterium]|jgi:hypothetical protein|nr:SiaB family protein kinase [Bacteroidales bacterium]